MTPPQDCSGPSCTRRAGGCGARRRRCPKSRPTQSRRCASVTPLASSSPSHCLGPTTSPPSAGPTPPVLQPERAPNVLYSLSVLENTGALANRGVGPWVPPRPPPLHRRGAPRLPAQGMRRGRPIGRGRRHVRGFPPGFLRGGGAASAGRHAAHDRSPFGGPRDGMGRCLCTAVETGHNQGIGGRGRRRWGGAWRRGTS